MAHFSVIDGPASGRTFELASRTALIGRDPACVIWIPDERISRRHLQVVFDGERGHHSVVDVGSSNGVTVNGSRLVRGVERVLEDGDEVTLGASCLRYVASP